MALTGVIGRSFTAFREFMNEDVLHGMSSNVVFRPIISIGDIIPEPELDRDPPEPETDEREDGAGEAQSAYPYEGEEEEEAVGSVSW